MSASGTSALRFQPEWKREMANLLRDPEELCERLELSGVDADALIKACRGFPLRVPRPYLARIEKARPQDPLLLQVLPQAEELLSSSGYSSDPLEEKAFSPVRGLLHKYHARVLIILGGSCSIHCRYCFRRHFPYQDHQLSKQQWHSVLDYIRRDSSIEEVIFSGGDPLCIADHILQARCHELEKIHHLKRIRIHSRLPVMIPARINRDFLSWAGQIRLQNVMVIHCNHAREIDPSVEEALARLTKAGFILLNQSVLLRGVNDDAQALAELSKRLFSCGVVPYYIHRLDPVQGAKHFSVGTDRIAALKQDLQIRLPGYLVPKFVTEKPYAQAKTLL